MNIITPALQKLELESNEPQISISFYRDLEKADLWALIAKYKQPEVVFWYIGANGFRQPGVSYYREHLQMISKLGNDARCFLYDLTAWGSLRKRHIRIDAVNPNVDRINEFAIKGIHAFPSSEFFSWLTRLDDTDLGIYIKKTVLNRKWIFSRSEKVDKTEITLREIFDKNCSTLEAMHDMDCGHTYSALQYLEAIYLICKFAEEAVRSKAHETNLIIALPNNEWEYYLDEKRSLEEDVRSILEMKNIQRLNVHFCFFKYGKKTSFRPYNSIGGLIDQLQKEDFF